MQITPLIVLAVGVLIGYITQSVSVRLRHDEEWQEIPQSKKVAMRATGAISALAVGLWILDQTTVYVPPSAFIYKMLFYQTLAGWGGALVLDAGSKAITTLIAKLSSKN